MAEIELRNLTKKYKRNVALRDVDLLVHDKEFIVLFGPAGAGKTTMLKILAGLLQPDEGEVRIGGWVVNTIPPANRNVSMVFENYALYPHLTVYDNIASPLRSPLHRKDEKSIREEIEKITGKMKIDRFLDRLPSQLSNGQRQRVALGRCLVREPNVFLMDEPLAHLDAKLRHFMRAELKEMQQSLDTTTIYVTHDYLEALSLGDRIVIINEGEIVQIGTRDELFYTPCNDFVARLVGEPEINLLPGRIIREEGGVRLNLLEKLYDLPGDVAEYFNERREVEYVNLGVRGNDVFYTLEDRNDRDYIKGSVYVLEPIGNRSILKVSVLDELIQIIVPNNFQCEMDSPIFIKPDLNDAMFFIADTGEMLVRHNMNELTGGHANA